MQKKDKLTQFLIDEGLHIAFPEYGHDVIIHSEIFDELNESAIARGEEVTDQLCIRDMAVQRIPSPGKGERDIVGFQELPSRREITAEEAERARMARKAQLERDIADGKIREPLGHRIKRWLNFNRIKRWLNFRYITGFAVFALSGLYGWFSDSIMKVLGPQFKEAFATIKESTGIGPYWVIGIAALIVFLIFRFGSKIPRSPRGKKAVFWATILMGIALIIVGFPAFAGWVGKYLIFWFGVGIGVFQLGRFAGSKIYKGIDGIRRWWKNRRAIKTILSGLPPGLSKAQKKSGKRNCKGVA